MKRSSARRQTANVVELWLPLAVKGHARAQYILGRMYAEGKGAPRDQKQAFDWLAKSAEQGNADAQLYLGVMYAKGRHIPRNDLKASHWLRFAAEAGLAKAQCYLSRMYAQGIGVPRSFVYAYMWAMLAATGGRRGADISRVGNEKIRAYALNTLETFARNMSREEASAAIRMAKKWRSRQIAP